MWTPRTLGRVGGAWRLGGYRGGVGDTWTLGMQGTWERVWGHRGGFVDIGEGLGTLRTLGRFWGSWGHQDTGATREGLWSLGTPGELGTLKRDWGHWGGLGELGDIEMLGTRGRVWRPWGHQGTGDKEGSGTLEGNWEDWGHQGGWGHWRLWGHMFAGDTGWGCCGTLGTQGLGTGCCHPAQGGCRDSHGPCPRPGARSPPVSPPRGRPCPHVYKWGTPRGGGVRQCHGGDGDTRGGPGDAAAAGG